MKEHNISQCMGCIKCQREYTGILFAALCALTFEEHFHNSFPGMQEYWSQRIKYIYDSDYCNICERGNGEVTCIKCKKYRLKIFCKCKENNNEKK